MRAFTYAIAAVLAAVSLANAESDPCSWSAFELSQQCIAYRGVADKLSAFEAEVAQAQRLYGTHYAVRVHVFESTAGSRFGGTTDDVFSVTETDNDPKAIGEDIWVRRSFLLDEPQILFEHAARHELAHALNGVVPGFRPDGGNYEAAAEHRVLELVGEKRYREYLQAYFVYRPAQRVDIDAFISVVRATIPSSMQ